MRRRRTKLHLSRETLLALDAVKIQQVRGGTCSDLDSYECVSLEEGGTCAHSTHC